jgi:hypothetical protein
MALLFTFVLFGASLIWEGLAILTPLTLLFALLVILARVAAFVPALAFTRLTRKEKLLISWFGPRGLSTLLLVLLAVFADAPGAEYMFAICSLVVLVSVVLHGGSMMFLGRISGRKARRAGTPPPPPGEPPAQPAPPAVVAVAEPEVAVALVPDGRAHEHEVAAPTPPTPAVEAVEAVEADDAHATAERITIAEMRMLQERGERVVLVDARTERTHGNSDRAAVGAVRIDPNAGMVAEQAAEQGIPKDAWLAIFCA